MTTWRLLLLSLALLVGGCPGSGDTGEDGGGEVGPAADGPSADTGGSDTTPACGPASCQGCCISGSICATGASHTQCGKGGAQCADCTANSGTCSGGTCTNCTPACSGKLCGASDGCGGTCQAGSGCCTPSCKGTLCGKADGCGGTCKTGSGCTEPACAYQADSDTLALFTFEGSGTTVTDVAGSHDGKIVGSGAKRTSGQSTCGNAMDFSVTSPVSYVEVPDASAWDLAVGSVDFWVRFDAAAPSGRRGIVSRDANGQTKAGHLTIFRLCNGSIYVRLQDTTTSWGVCSDPVSIQTWHHVGVNFGGSGGLKLYIDQKLATRTTDITCGTSTWSCGSGSTTKGIAGNDNPWVVGAAAWHSVEGSASGVDEPFNGQLDSLRISKARRSF